MKRLIVLTGAVTALVAAAALLPDSSAAGSVTPAAAATTLDDAGVLAIFDLANAADIETGRLAAERASSKEVRDFGRMLADVHTAVRQQGQDLAKKLGVVPALPPGDGTAAQHAEVMARLKTLKGHEFELAFLRHEVAFHSAVLDAVKTTLLPAIQREELRKFVVSLAPAFEAHRLAADALAKKLAN